MPLGQYFSLLLADYGDKGWASLSCAPGCSAPHRRPPQLACSFALRVVFLIRYDHELEVGVSGDVACLPLWRLCRVHLQLRGIDVFLRIQGCLDGGLHHGLALVGRRLCPVRPAHASLVHLLEVHRPTGIAVLLSVIYEWMRTT